jgi:predicted RNase H-like nuclease (RuvC/YqgF family)
MRRGIGFALGFICVLLLGATIMSYSSYKKSAAQFTAATEAETQTRLRYDQAVSEIVTIQDSLNAIVLGPDGGRFVPARPLDEMQPPGTLHDTVLARIATLKAAVERTRDRIEELDKGLKRSGVKIQGLERMVAGLRRSATEKEVRITELTTQVDTLQTRVAGLSTSVVEQQSQLDVQHTELVQKQAEIATIYYAMGTKKELTNSGVVTSKGGVLGFGKTLEPSGQFNEAAFVALDTDQENVIRISAEKAQVLSAQPHSSYVLSPIGKDSFELRIIDPAQFRKVKHLVILTTT